MKKKSQQTKGNDFFKRKPPLRDLACHSNFSQEKNSFCRADVNYKDKNGFSTFAKSVGKLFPSFISEFLNEGINFQEIPIRNMNYFEYMLYRKNYSATLKVIKHGEVYDFLRVTKYCLYI